LSFFSIRRLVISSVSGHRFLAHIEGIEQIHLWQLAVGHVREQGLLPLFDHALAARNICHARFNDPWRSLGLRHRHFGQIQLTTGRAIRHRIQVPRWFYRQRGQGLFPFAQSLLSQSHVFFNLAFFMA
jgi:hypothetical protein